MKYFPTVSSAVKPCFLSRSFCVDSMAFMPISFLSVVSHWKWSATPWVPHLCFYFHSFPAWLLLPVLSLEMLMSPIRLVSHCASTFTMGSSLFFAIRYLFHYSKWRFLAMSYFLFLIIMHQGSGKHKACEITSRYLKHLLNLDPPPTPKQQSSGITRASKHFPRSRTR